ncbi:beta-ketoacyl synthase chain length factor [Reichenbachiella ulvae]|uniref:Beta-ketoacyl synthase chain length factor n=1 Tax=Reichenbachiella ulvae TaxID=2980104 RepID=A0ABT3CU74_9BACT|nr:beta-ketoacyl synthase chain length factor [Reichenbachiella ulvae]MCV9387182.1 beta-ketoacyl synthase chain length factor [Reichenbachiella ulvae]
MRKVFIQSAVSITCQPSFLNENLYELKIGKANDLALLEPNYKDFIPPAMIRRASKMMKMSLASSQACMQQAGVEDLGAIIVGSGLGCLMDTEKFLKSSILAEEGSLIPPLSFIQSGHNSVSGQIALQLKNQRYNMTHVQKGLSFEYALMDAMLRIKEGDQAVMLGGVDEKIDVLDELAKAVDWPEDMRNELAEGCSFFVLKDESDAGIEVADVKIVSTSKIEVELEALLQAHDLRVDDSIGNFVGLNEVQEADLDINHQLYTQWIGRYFSSSAFGFHLAYDKLKNEGKAGDFSVVINLSNAQYTGLTLLRRV